MNEVNVVPAGRVSESETPVAASDPLFVTVIVKSNVPPGATGFGLADMDTDTSELVAVIVGRIPVENPTVDSVVVTLSTAGVIVAVMNSSAVSGTFGENVKSITPLGPSVTSLEAQKSLSLQVVARSVGRSRRFDWRREKLQSIVAETALVSAVNLCRGGISQVRFD